MLQIAERDVGFTPRGLDYPSRVGTQLVEAVSFDATLPILAFALFLGGMATLLVLLIQVLRTARLGRREKIHRLTLWQSDLNRAIAVILATIGIGAGNTLFWLHGELQMYEPFTLGVPLGKIEIHNGKELPHLVFTTRDETGREAAESVQIRDNFLRLHGERIRWAHQLEVLGLTDFFKLTYVECRAMNSGFAGGKPPIIADVRSGSTDLFARLRAFHRWLPFVRVDSLASAPFEAAKEFSAQLYADSTGLTLQ